MKEGDLHVENLRPVRFALAGVLAMLSLVVTSASSQALLLDVSWPKALGRLAVAPSVLAAVQRGDAPEVIVALDDGADAAASDATLQAKVRAAQDEVLDALGPNFETIYRYGEVPALAGRITAAGLATLAGLDRVVAVEANDRARLALAESIPLIRAEVVWNKYGLTGEGITVGVLDTGIDNKHPDFAEKVVDQHCYSSSRSCAPNNTVESTDAQDEIGHGTMVSGIILSKGAVSRKGVAPGAKLAMARVFRDIGDATDEDIVAGLDWMLRNATKHNIRVVNMSLGSGAARGLNCDGQEPTIKSAFGRLVARGVAVFVATGNDGLTDLVASPACVSNAIAVGASYDARFGSVPGCEGQGAVLPTQIACFTNRGRAMDLLAPGFLITGPRLGGGLESGAGTSFAAPMAAGVAALMLQANPDLRPSDVERILRDTGTPVKHPESGEDIPFINAEKAVAAVITPRATSTATPTRSATVTPQPTATPRPSPTGGLGSPTPTAPVQTRTATSTAEAGTPSPATTVSPGVPRTPTPAETESPSIPPTRPPTGTALPASATPPNGTDRHRIFVPWCVRE